MPHISASEVVTRGVEVPPVAPFLATRVGREIERGAQQIAAPAPPEFGRGEPRGSLNRHAVAVGEVWVAACVHEHGHGGGQEQHQQAGTGAPEQKLPQPAGGPGLHGSFFGSRPGRLKHSPEVVAALPEDPG